MIVQTRLLAALVALAAAAVPAGAFAQSAPDGVPSYATGAPSYGAPGETIHGRVLSFDGAYNLQVRDDRGFVDNVQLQQGTVINPTGIRLQTGMVVSIQGVNRGSSFAANVIETPYPQYGAVPVGPYDASVYPYPAYPYPYPAYPYPYPVYGGYPYGPNVSIGIGFGFGFGGGFHGGSFHGGGFHGGGFHR
jgi:hypothetical protein